MLAKKLSLAMYNDLHLRVLQSFFRFACLCKVVDYFFHRPNSLFLRSPYAPLSFATDAHSHTVLLERHRAWYPLSGT